jgi:hypothetical protein
MVRVCEGKHNDLNDLYIIGYRRIQGEGAGAKSYTVKQVF